ncbi:TonB-dependent receptor [Bacteroidia bacterium]|nr:TonB-dependent receptor [Bacteroidia bacterium]GHV70374.1 TonB-dependent receptor [Bacteroidia bacterium]
MKTKMLMILFGLLIVANGYSQKKIIGKVIDENGIAISNAVITHLDNQNGSLIKNTVADEKGYFEIDNVKFEIERIKITAIGYKDFDILSEPLTDSLQIVLRPLSVELGEVVIQGKSFITQKTDRLVFNIANSNITKGSNTYDLLKFTPLVRVDDERLTILGKNDVMLYINGKNSHLSTDAIRNYLRSLPSDRIASVEVITNPLSNFRISGNEGIINIVLKKNESDGLRGIISLNDSYQHFNSTDGSAYLYYQKNKLNLSINLYGGNNKHYTKTKAEYTYFNSGKQNIVENTIAPNNVQAGTNIMADYKLSDKQTLGIMLNGIYQEKRDNRTAQTYYRQLNVSGIDSIIHSDTKLRTPGSNFTANLNYRLKTDKNGSQLSLDLDFLRNNKDAKTYANFSRLENTPIQDYYTQFIQQSKDYINNFSGKAEYNHVLDKKSNIAAGIEFSSLDSKMDFFYGNLFHGEYVNDNKKSNIFNYKESYEAGFITYSKVWNNKFNSTMGVRLEHTHGKGEQEKGDTHSVDRNQVDVLPTLALQYVANPNHRLSLNFTSAVTRTPISILNPFQFYSTPTTYSENNPDLKSAKLYIAAFNYILKRHYILGVNYGHIINCFNSFTLPAENEYTKIKTLNYGDANQLAFMLTWNDSFWQNRIYVNVSAQSAYMEYKGNVESLPIDIKGFYYNFSLAGGVQVSKKYNWNITTNYTFASKSKLAQENINASNRLNIEAKKVFSNNASLIIGIRSLLYTKSDSQKAFDNYYYYMNYLQSNRTFYATVSIPFGNIKAKGAQSRKTSSSIIKSRLSEEK